MFSVEKKVTLAHVENGFSIVYLKIKESGGMSELRKYNMTLYHHYGPI